MEQNQTFQQRLEAVHDFPCEFSVKAIGLNETAFIERIEEVARRSLTDQTPPQFTQRTSSGGKHVSVGIHFTAPDAPTIVSLYEAITSVEGLTYLI